MEMMDVVEELLGRVVARMRRDFEEALTRRDDAIRVLRREIRTLRDEIGVERGLTALKVEAEQARQQARDRELESLRCEIKTLRDEVALERGLSALKIEVNEARQRAPNFQSELDALREQVSKQQKTISRLRAEQSQLAYAQAQATKEITLTGFRLTTEIGAQTRAVLERLRENGFDLVDEMPPLSGLAS